jgi:hypothetical protein
MSGYNNNDAYGTSGTTGGLGVCLIFHIFKSFIEAADKLTVQHHRNEHLRKHHQRLGF